MNYKDITFITAIRLLAVVINARPPVHILYYVEILHILKDLRDFRLLGNYVVSAHGTAQDYDIHLRENLIGEIKLVGLGRLLWNFLSCLSNNHNESVLDYRCLC